MERVTRQVPLPPGVHFEVLDCPVDGFVHKGRTIVISARLARMSPAQRFFIIAHELGHLKLQHHAAILSFVSRAVSSSPDESGARALIASGLAAISHQAELDADAFAVRAMLDAGLDADEAARIFDGMGEGSDNGTHPSPGRRARAIRSAALN
ncbi:M48 family metalloprotease [Piscinibacter terrae]|uniref:M48 family metalloprotease n=1 Tax=Piscinibacter terrae TaxID=2496871 RepID=UPI002E26CCB2|nr:M48 family metalloprotease [Albitalea terrae]